jgi:hypothetical protein
MIMAAPQAPSPSRPGELHESLAAAGLEPAVSVHAYSPPLTARHRYRLTAVGLALADIDRAELDW